MRAEAGSAPEVGRSGMRCVNGRLWPRSVNDFYLRQWGTVSGLVLLISWFSAVPVSALQVWTLLSKRAEPATAMRAVFAKGSFGMLKPNSGMYMRKILIIGKSAPLEYLH